MKKIFIAVVLVLMACSWVMGQSDEVNIDSLERVFNSNQHDTTRLNALRVLISKLPYDHANKCISLEKKAVALARKADDRDSEAYVYYTIGIAYAIKFEHDTALNYMKKAVSLEKEIKKPIKPKNLITYLTGLAIVHTSLGQYEDAVKIYYEQLTKAKDENDNKRVAIIYYNIGNTYFNMAEYPTALINFRKARKLYTNEIQIADCYQAEGSVYENMDSLELVLKQYDMAKTIYEKYKKNNHLATLHHNISYINIRLKNYNEAINNAFTSINYFDNAEVEAGKIDPYLDLFHIYKELNQLEKADLFLKKALILGEETNDVGLKSKLYEDSYLFYEATKNYKPAFDNLSKYFVLKDSLSGIEKSKQVKELNIKYNTAQKEAKIQLQKYVIWATTSIIVVFVLAFVIFIILYHKIKQAKQEAEKQRQIADEQTKKAENYANNLEEVNGYLEKKKQEVEEQRDIANVEKAEAEKQKAKAEGLEEKLSHHIINDFSLFKDISKFSTKNITFKDQITEETFRALQHRSFATQILYEIILDKSNDFDVHDMQKVTLVLAEKMCERYGRTDINCTVTGKLELRGEDKRYFMEFVLELVRNSNKYAFKNSGGQIVITLATKGEKVHFTYQDNGTGLPAKHEKGRGSAIIQNIVTAYSENRYTISNRTDGNSGVLVEIEYKLGKTKDYE